MSKPIQYKYLHECVADYLRHSDRNVATADGDDDDDLFNDDLYTYVYEEIESNDDDDYVSVGGDNFVDVVPCHKT